MLQSGLRDMYIPPEWVARKKTSMHRMGTLTLYESLRLGKHCVTYRARALSREGKKSSKSLWFTEKQHTEKEFLQRKWRPKCFVKFSWRLSYSLAEINKRNPIRPRTTGTYQESTAKKKRNFPDFFRSFFIYNCLQCSRP